MRFVRLKDQWVNLAAIAYVVDFGDGGLNVRYNNGQEFVYQGDDAQKLRDAMAAQP